MNARDLVGLLNASFQSWAVNAHAEPLGDDSLAARINAPDRRSIHVRYLCGDTNGARWHYGTENAPADASDWAVSIGGLLKALRQHYDPTFTAGRAIIGRQPSVR